MRVQLPSLWAGFDRTCCYRRAAEAKRQLDSGRTVVKVDRMRFRVVTSILQRVNMVEMQIDSFMILA